MKILVWSYSFWPGVGGTEVQTLALIQAMRAKGHACQVIANKRPDLPEVEVYQEIPIKRFAFQPMVKQQNLRQMGLVRNYLESLKTDFQPDLIHFHSGTPSDLLIFSLFKNVLSIPAILTIHGSWGTAQEYILPINSTFLPFFERICCVSDWIVEMVKKQIPEAGEKLQLIYNGLLPQAALPSPLCFSPPTLFMYGRHVVEKGFETAIRAFSLLKKNCSPARLIIGGDGPERGHLEELVWELYLDQSVTFTSTLTQQEVAGYLNQATLVLVPSSIEPFGLVLLEAMQMERPVIASCVGGMKEIVAHEKTGLLVPPEDPEALYLAITELLKTPHKAIEMGKAGAKRAQEFSLEKHLSEYEALYNEVKWKKSL